MTAPLNALLPAVPDLPAGNYKGKKSGDAKLLYQPFELHTRWRKVAQMSIPKQPCAGTFRTSKRSSTSA